MVPTIMTGARVCTAAEDGASGSSCARTRGDKESNPMAQSVTRKAKR